MTDHVDRVLAGELRGAIETATADLECLISTAKDAMIRIEAGEPGATGYASRVASDAKSAAHSLMRVAVVRGKIEGVALCRSVLS